MSLLLVLLAATAPEAATSPVERALVAFQPRSRGFESRIPSLKADVRIDRLGAHLQPTDTGTDTATPLTIRLAAVDGIPLPTEAPVEPLACAPVPQLDPQGDCIPAVQRDFGPVTEWWQALPDGIQQGFTVYAGSDHLTLDIAVEGVVEVELMDGDVWLTADDGTAWTASGLAAWDADGMVLPVTAVPGTEPGLQLVVDTRGARFPVTVDPIYATAATTLNADASDDFFGISVDGAGDLNGDGYDDLIVGGNRADSFVGKAWVFYGSASGVSALADETLVPPVTGQFGFHVSALGDTDGDGYPEVGVGAPFSDSRDGRIYVYSGTPAGLDTTPDIISGPVSGGYFGLAFDGGDVNGDGYADLVASSYCYSGCRGRLYVFEGSASGLSTTPATTIDGPTTTAYYGQALASGGDVDGDGIHDVIVAGYGANGGEGVVDVFLGQSSGLSTAPVATRWGSSGAYLGRVVAMGGDLNADGYDDVAYSAGVGGGTAFVAFGGPSGPDLAGATAYSGGNIGGSMAVRDDSDADGYGELVLGDPSSGSVYVYRGTSSGVSATAGSTLSGSGGAGYYAAALADVGDVNGDGAGDLVVGAPGEGTGGRAHVYHGYIDADGDGLALEEDCDDSRSDVGGPEPGFVDADGDGFGDAAAGTMGCAGAPGFSLDATDCDDDDDAVFPGATEVVGDHVDQDCDGLEECFVDSDADGFADDAGTTAPSTDDTCDGAGLADADTPATDCDDTDAAVNPDATDVPGDGVDQDCDGTDAVDDTHTGAGDSGLDDTGVDDTGASGGDGKGSGCSTVGGAGSLAWLWAFGAALAAGGRRRP